MTVRTAELVAAILLALASIGLMVKSAELNIGWVKGSGPGAGAWPFWLSAGMLASCVLIIIRWFLRITPESRSEEVFINGNALKIVGLTVGALIFLLGATHFIGMYFAIVFFLIFFLKVMGGHSWVTTGAITVGTPIVIFGFFEWALKQPLPKALSEPLFYPIYDLMY